MRKLWLVLAFVVASVPVAGADEPAVRPGTRVIGSNGNSCTLGFLYVGSDDESYFATSPGCAGVDGGSVLHPSGRLVGSYAYVSPETSFALVRVADGVTSDAAVLYRGGPTGLNDDSAPSGFLVSTSGMSNPFGFGLYAAKETIYGGSAFTAFGWDLSDPRVVGAVASDVGVVIGGPGTPYMTSDGRAVGISSNVIGGGGFEGSTTEVLVDPPGTVRIVRLAPVIAVAEAALGISLDLQTSALTPPPPPPTPSP